VFAKQLSYNTLQGIFVFSEDEVFQPGPKLVLYIIQDGLARRREGKMDFRFLPSVLVWAKF